MQKAPDVAVVIHVTSVDVGRPTDVLSTFALSPRRPESNETHPLRASASREFARVCVFSSRTVFTHGVGDRRGRTRRPATGSRAWSPPSPTPTRSCRTSAPRIQAQQEGVNKAIVDVQTARDNAATAQREVDASQARASRTPTPRSPPRRQRFDTFAAGNYVNGPTDSYLTASDPADILSTAADRSDVVK